MKRRIRRRSNVPKLPFCFGFVFAFVFVFFFLRWGLANDTTGMSTDKSTRQVSNSKEDM